MGRAADLILLTPTHGIYVGLSRDTGRETRHHSGYSTPRFFLPPSAKICPLSRLEIGSRAPISLTPPAVRGTFPCILTPPRSLAPAGAMSHPVAGAGHGPLSCDPGGINAFFPRLLTTFTTFLYQPPPLRLVLCHYLRGLGFPQRPIGHSGVQGACPHRAKCAYE